MSGKNKTAPDAVVTPPVEPPVVASEPAVEPPAKHGLFGRAKAGVVRSRVHMDDTSDTGKSYRPGDTIKGWDQEKIDRLVASGQVELVD